MAARKLDKSGPGPLPELSLVFTALFLGTARLSAFKHAGEIGRDNQAGVFHRTLCNNTALLEVLGSKHSIVRSWDELARKADGASAELSIIS